MASVTNANVSSTLTSGREASTHPPGRSPPVNDVAYADASWCAYTTDGGRDGRTRSAPMNDPVGPG